MKTIGNTMNVGDTLAIHCPAGDVAATLVEVGDGWYRADAQVGPVAVRLTYANDGRCIGSKIERVDAHTVRAKGVGHGGE